MSVVMQFDDNLIIDFGFDSSSILSEETMRGIDAGRWLGKPMLGNGSMRYSGIYSDKGDTGMLFTISVPGCGDEEESHYKLGRGIFGYLELDGLLWFTLLTNGGAFDAPFAAFQSDIGTRVLTRWARAGSMQDVKLVYLDGTSVLAVRTVFLEDEWLARFGEAMGRLPFMETAQQHAAAQASGADRFETMEMIALSDHIKF